MLIEVMGSVKRKKTTLENGAKYSSKVWKLSIESLTKSNHSHFENLDIPNIHTSKTFPFSCQPSNSPVTFTEIY